MTIQVTPDQFDPRERQNAEEASPMGSQQANTEDVADESIDTEDQDLLDDDLADEDEE